MIATTPVDILRFLLASKSARVETVLVTLVRVAGASPRALGAQMTVAADGTHVGSLSGGCIEAAIAAEAQDVLAIGNARLVRFGAGSPYFDIRLPCGGSIDLLFTPRPDTAIIEKLVSRIDERKPAGLNLSLDGLKFLECSDNSVQPGWRAKWFEKPYLPALRIVAIGQGDDLISFARLARAFGADVSALSPDERALAILAAEKFDVTRLKTRTQLPPFRSDHWTAIAFLFHDHDWEDELLPQALMLPSFYLGVVGSRRTHTGRLERLSLAGIEEPVLAALHGPIGAIPKARDPATLALSILSEVVTQHIRIASDLPTKRDALDAH